MEGRREKEYPGQIIDSTFQPGEPGGFSIPNALSVGRVIHSTKYPVNLRVLDWGTAQEEEGGMRKPAFKVAPIGEDEVASEIYVIIYDI